MKPTEALTPNTTCLACGTRYYHCKTCDEYKRISFWRSNACCPEHFKVFMAAHEYAVGEIDATTAREQLKQTKYEDVLKCDTDVARIVRKILTETAQQRKKYSKEPQDSEELE